MVYLADLFEALAARRLRYCLLRDADRLLAGCAQREVDLLVDPRDLRPLAAVVSAEGFVPLRAWGHAPHHFFLRAERTADPVKLDVVTAVALGRPVHRWRTDLGESCLAHRQRSGPLFIPAAEDELITLLLHCVVDKARFSPAHWKRLRCLAEAVGDEARMAGLVQTYGPPDLDWPELKARILADQWACLLAERKAIEQRLAGRGRLAALRREVQDRLLRKLNRLIPAPTAALRGEPRGPHRALCLGAQTRAPEDQPGGDEPLRATGADR